MQGPDQANAKARVEVIENCGEWFVHVTESGKTAATNSFEIEAFALAFAEGQRIRLGLERYEIL